MATMPVNPQTAAQSDPGLFDKWRSWLGSPENRNAMLQTGLALMQPLQPGQSQFSHIASSIGEGLGAAGRTEARMREEQIAQDKLNRELEQQALDAEVKRTGLELDKLNTQSQIGSRAASDAAERARLGLEEKKLVNDTRYTDAQIANLQSQSDTREGDLARKTAADKATADALATKNALEREKLAITQEIAQARQAGDAKRAQQAEARLAQTDQKIAISQQRLQQAEAAAQRISLQSMFKARDAVTKDVWTAANDPYAVEPRSMDELLAERIRLQQETDRLLGVPGSGQSTGNQPPPSPTSGRVPQEGDIVTNGRGQRLVLRNNQWQPLP